MKAQRYFWRIILLIAYIISIIFWLSAWAWSASVASVWLTYSVDYSYDCGFDNNNNYVCNTTSDNAGKREGSVLAACAGLGALIWYVPDIIPTLCCTVPYCMLTVGCAGSS
jgi:hypothetical protein